MLWVGRQHLADQASPNPLPADLSRKERAFNVTAFSISKFT